MPITLPTDLGADLIAWYNADDFLGAPYDQPPNDSERQPTWYTSPYEGSLSPNNLEYHATDPGFYVSTTAYNDKAWINFSGDTDVSSSMIRGGIGETVPMAFSAFVRLFGIVQMKIVELGPFTIYYDNSSNSFKLTYQMDDGSYSTVFKANSSLSTIGYTITVGVDGSTPYMFINGQQLSALDAIISITGSTYNSSDQFVMASFSGNTAPLAVGEMAFYAATYQNMVDMDQYFFYRWFVEIIEITFEFDSNSDLFIQPLITFDGPQSLENNLFCWYDAAQFLNAPYNFTVDTRIPLWEPPPLSPFNSNLAHTLVSDGSIDPLVKLNILNSLPGLSFSKPAHASVEVYSDVEFNPGNYWAVSFVVTVFPDRSPDLTHVLFNNDSLSISYVSSDGDEEYSIQVYEVTNSGDTIDFYKKSSMINPGAYLVTIIHDNLSNSLRVNRVDQAPLDTQYYNVPQDLYDSTYFSINGNSDFPQPLIHEYIMYDPRNGNLATMEDYLTNKWMGAPMNETNITFAGIAALTINDANVILSALGDSIYVIPVDVFPSIPPKDVTDVIDYDFEFNRWLEFGETIVSVITNATLGLSVLASNISGSKVKILTIDGIPSTDHTISCQIVTSLSRRKTSRFTLRINP